jgi:hypothetical protein
MIHSKVLFLSISALPHFDICSIVYFCPQNVWPLHHHVAEHVQTSGCFIISVQICNKLYIALVMLGICIKIE